MEILTVEENSTVAIVGYGKFGEKKLEGFALVLYSKEESNFYGYIKLAQLEVLSSEPYDVEKVTVLPSTALLSLPSFVRDSRCTQIELLKATADVKVLSNLNGYECMGTKYLLVEIDGDPNRIGFVDVQRTRKRDLVKDKIITNAEVKRNNSEIFTEESSESEIITMLDKGARVKVIGKRNTKTNLTKVSFNDKAGNLHTGYIYTYNLETDTWSMLQIIGMMLIIINTILLIIIICLKNKYTK